MSKLPDKFLNAYEVAEIIGLDHTTIRNGQAGTDEIPRIKLGSRTLFSELAVRQWMAKKAKEAEEKLTQEKSEANNFLIERSRKRTPIRDGYLALIKPGRHTK